MTKMDLIDAISRSASVSKAEAGRLLDTMLDAIASALARGEKVTITGFGTYEVRERAARMGRNPQTGAPLHIPASKSPAFRAGKGLKDRVR